MKQRITASVLAALAAAFVLLPHGARAAGEVHIRVSVKRVLSLEGELPRGRWGSAEEIRDTIGKCNRALERSGSNWVLDLVEIRDSTAASRYYAISSGDLANLERDARRNAAGYFWSDEAVNIYVVDTISDAGGVCSFPAFGPHRHVIAIHSQGILGGSEGWLHEIGHYFNLIHTHDGDEVADTFVDPDLPSPFDCRLHDRNFIDLATEGGAYELDVFNTLHNVMSYHCEPLVLTPLQLVRMERALADFRSHVRVTQGDAPPAAVVELPPAAAGGVLAWNGEPVAIELDGSASHDGDGGRDIDWTWSIVAGGDGAELLGGLDPGVLRGWPHGRSGFGYGDDDDLTELDDMQGSYLAVYVTRSFEIADPGVLEGLVLDITWDDGFAAFLNGVEVARRNLPEGAGPATPAVRSIESPRERIDLTARLGLLRRGTNRLAIEVHNHELESSDLSLHPVLEGVLSGGRLADLIPSRAVWRYRRGSEGAPPAEWSEPEFDPEASRAVLSISAPGRYRVRLEVDDRSPTANLASTEVEILVGGGAVPFVRGDCNSDRTVDLSDAIAALVYLFSAGAEPRCLDACDTDDDERVGITDAVALLDHLFRGGASPAPPFPAAGLDPLGDGLGCM